jgi:hypothetical protein
MIALVVAAALAAASGAHHAVRSPYSMGDWATCRDGTHVYSRNPQFPLEPPSETPCALHGGVRAWGVGKRLNER